MKDSEITYKDYTDMQGNRIREQYSDGKMTERTRYNSLGQMVEVLYPGDLRSCYIYDGNGDEIECNQYFIDEDGVETHAYRGFRKYDDQGRLIDYEYENIHDGHFHYTYKYEMIEGKTVMKEYNEDGELTNMEVLE